MAPTALEEVLRVTCEQPKPHGACPPIVAKRPTPPAAPHHGVIEADSPKRARTQLRARGLTPITVDPLAGGDAARRGATTACWYAA